MRPLLAACAAAIAVALTAPATAQVRSTIIGPGVKRFPIAVPPLQAGAGASDQFARVLSRDLDLSGLFRIIPSDTYIDDAQTGGVTAESINFDNWSVIGALALVKGTAERSGDDLTIEARLFDVALHKQLSGRRFHGRAADEARMANRFADEIIQYFTGERGPFDSEIAFLSTRGGRFKDVYIMDANGDDVRRVTNDNTLNLSPSWAPDARALVLTSYQNGNPDLFSVALPAGRLTKLSALRGLNLGGHWAPDGRRIAVTVEYDGNPEIALLNPDGSLLRRLTDHWAVDVSAVVVARWPADCLLLRPFGRATDLHHGCERRRRAAGEYHRHLQHLAELGAEGRAHCLCVAHRRPLSDLHGEDRRQRCAPGHRERGQQ